MGVGKGESFIASDVPAIIEYTRDYYLLEHEEIAVLDDNGVQIFDAFGQPVKKELKTADWDVEAIGKGGYAHFMLKEIHEQPNAIRNTILPRIQDGLPNLEECGITPEVLREFRHIQVVACGTAMHAGTVGKYVIEKLARVPVTVDIASEFRYRERWWEKEIWSLSSPSPAKLPTVWQLCGWRNHWGQRLLPLSTQWAVPLHGKQIC